MLENKIETFKNSIKKLNESNEKSKEDMNKVRQDYKIECEKVKSLSIKLQEEKEIIDEVKREHQNEIYHLTDDYKKIINTLKANIDQLKGSSAKEQGSLLDELQLNRNKVTNLEKQLNEAQKDIHTKDVLLKAEIMKVASLNSQISDLQRNIKFGSSNFEAERNELLKKIHDLTQSKDVLKAQYSELNARITELTKSNIGKDNLVNQQMEEQARTLRDLQLKTDEAEVEKEELFSKIQQLDQKIFSMKLDHENAIKELERKHSDEIFVKENQIEELKMEARLLGQKLSNTDKNNNSTEKELKNKDNEIVKLKQEIESLTERIRVMLAEIDKK